MDYSNRLADAYVENWVLEEQVRIAFSQTIKGIVGGGLGAILLVWALWPAVSHTLLLGWLATLLVVATLRLYFYVGYQRRDKSASTKLWERRFLIGTFLHALTWGAAWWAFLPVAQGPEYTLLAALWLVALSAASFSAYIVHLPSMLAFFVPLVAPGIVRIFFLEGQLNTVIAFGLCVYSWVVLSSMLPVHRAMTASIRLNFENAHEINERKRMEGLLRDLSIRDGLTGLATRRHFDEELAKELKRAQRSQTEISLLLVDIDSFKALNDSRGHIAGDECLRRVAERIIGSDKRAGDLAARYGGEEFVLVLPNTDQTEASEVAERLRSGIESLRLPHPETQVEGCEVITVSIGVATLVPTQNSEANDLIQPADKALYLAKRNGRNRIEMGRPE